MNYKKAFIQYLKDNMQKFQSYKWYIFNHLEQELEQKVLEISGKNVFEIDNEKDLTALVKLLNRYDDWEAYNNYTSNGIANALLNTHYRKFLRIMVEENNEEATHSETVELNKYSSFMPLNLILYGPPGTGKTYNSVVYAVAAVEGVCVEDIRAEEYAGVKERFDSYKKAGIIDFVTFHQSYSYEEFVEGIKPALLDGEDWEESQDIKYHGKDGVFKNICKYSSVAKFKKKSAKIDFTKTRIFKLSLGRISEPEIYNYCRENSVITLGWGSNVDFSDCATFEKISQKYKDKTGADDWAPYAIERFKNWMRKGDIVLISSGTKNIQAIVRITGDYRYEQNSEIPYNHYRDVEWLYEGNIPVSRILNRNLSQQSIYAFSYFQKEGTEYYNDGVKTEVLNDLLNGDNEEEKYNSVLIIDEINRGNISKIFGELITLLEEDKRGEFSVTLPYSQQEFTVPKNLYLIGTMNTSDRSIAAVDIALRRRFRFVEMMPKSGLVADFGIGFAQMFSIMNERITILLDRDHQIGHSYFMADKYADADVGILKQIWFDCVLPLFNEYFYGDWEKLQALLGKADDSSFSFIRKLETKGLFVNYDCDADEAFDFRSAAEYDDSAFEKALKYAFLSKKGDEDR